GRVELGQRSAGVHGTLVAVVYPVALKSASSTNWNRQVVSRPNGTICAFSVAPVSLTFVNDSLKTSGGPGIVGGPSIVTASAAASVACRLPAPGPHARPSGTVPG